MNDLADSAPPSRKGQKERCYQLHLQDTDIGSSRLPFNETLSQTKSSAKGTSKNTHLSPKTLASRRLANLWAAIWECVSMKQVISNLAVRFPHRKSILRIPSSGEQY
ncbi:MAG: hypothetical protein BroJett006_30790 [Betaproteobacteria bacterium]|nr:MAG: hypothetical protein BroJett006_30790 [Betaproteobacteria bacterium]